MDHLHHHGYPIVQGRRYCDIDDREIGKWIKKRQYGEHCGADSGQMQNNTAKLENSCCESINIRRV